MPDPEQLRGAYMAPRNHSRWIFLGSLSWGTLQTWIFYWILGFELAVLTSLGLLMGFLVYTNSRLPTDWVPRV
jgi:hypothetical protein